MLYRFDGRRVLARGLEFSVAHHCNLPCAGCSHLSPYQDKRFPSFERFSSALDGLRDVLHVEEFRLLGGEPLLNPEAGAFVEAARRSGIADKITVITNGLLLPSMPDSFWSAVDRVVITVYPGTREAIEKRLPSLADRAGRSRTELVLRQKHDFRMTILTAAQPEDRITDMIFKTCRSVHFGHCHMLHEGKLHKCAVPPFLPAYLARLEPGPPVPADDGLDILGRPRLFEDLKAFLLSPGPLKACRYCLGYLGKTREHRFLTPDLALHPGREPITRESSLDRRKLVLGAFRYRLRRLNERLTGRPLW